MSEVLALYNPAGRMVSGIVSGVQKIWRADVISRVIAHLVEMKGAPGIRDRVTLVQQALDTLKPPAAPDAAPQDTLARFRVALADRVQRHERAPRKTFRVLFALNVTARDLGRVQRISVLGRTFVRTTWGALAKELDLQEWWQRAEELLGYERASAVLQGSFTPFVASIEARTPDEAWAEISRAFDLVRVVLKLQGSWGRVMASAGWPQPLGRVQPSPLSAVFGEQGRQVAWYHVLTPRDFGLSPYRRVKLARAQPALRWLDRIKAKEIQDLLVDALLKYGEALDTIEWAQAFLALWQALELLTLQWRDDANTGSVKGRLALLLGQDPLDADLLDALSETRNVLVHAGRYPVDYGQQEVLYLKRLVERGILALVGWARLLRSRNTLSAIYENLGTRGAELSERQRAIAAIVRRRRKAQTA